MAIQQTKITEEELKELGDKLKEKYGDSQIDLKTGELIQSE